MRWHFRILAIAVLALGACTVGPQMSSPPPPVEVDPPVEVEARGFLFRPDAIEVEVGTTVRFTNFDNIDHTVTAGTPESPTGDFDLDLPEMGAEAEITFDAPGTYAYFCAIHNHMRGTIRVGDG